MKNAKEWQEELAGETSLESILNIQRDAILHALTIAIVAITNGEGRNGIIRRIQAEADKLKP